MYLIPILARLATVAVLTVPLNIKPNIETIDLYKNMLVGLKIKTIILAGTKSDDKKDEYVEELTNYASDNNLEFLLISYKNIHSIKNLIMLIANKTHDGIIEREKVEQNLKNVFNIEEETRHRNEINKESNIITITGFKNKWIIM